ncbi:hypothetical protein [Bacillus sp. BHET2]|uniref:hypothetical protein n=1 Tax=Bacillus sp. BHET2 TaxID=2583818 RepID=UPI001486BAFF|nr:hypothetical protein [Bacillus sp. BHET2]
MRLIAEHFGAGPLFRQRSGSMAPLFNPTVGSTRTVLVLPLDNQQKIYYRSKKLNTILTFV